MTKIFFQLFVPLQQHKMCHPFGMDLNLPMFSLNTARKLGCIIRVQKSLLMAGIVTNNLSRSTSFAKKKDCNGQNIFCSIGFILAPFCLIHSAMKYMDKITIHRRPTLDFNVFGQLMLKWQDLLPIRWKSQKPFMKI